MNSAKYSITYNLLISIILKIILTAGEQLLTSRDDAVQIGKDGVLSCSAKTQDLVLSWFKDPSAQEFLKRVTPASHNTLGPLRDGIKRGILPVRNASVDDEGCYRCSTTLNNTESSSVACLLVYMLPEVSFSENGDLITCSVTSRPASRIFIEIPSPQTISTEENKDGSITRSVSISLSKAAEPPGSKVTCVVTYFGSTRKYSFLRKIKLQQYAIVITIFILIVIMTILATVKIINFTLLESSRATNKII